MAIRPKVYRPQGLTIPIGDGRSLNLLDSRVWPFLLTSAISYYAAYRARSWVGFITATSSVVLYWSLVISPPGQDVVQTNKVRDPMWDEYLPRRW